MMTMTMTMTPMRMKKTTEMTTTPAHMNCLMIQASTRTAYAQTHEEP
jgi:hypothetical protein